MAWDLGYLSTDIGDASANKNLVSEIESLASKYGVDAPERGWWEEDTYSSDVGAYNQALNDWYNNLEDSRVQSEASNLATGYTPYTGSASTGATASTGSRDSSPTYTGIGTSSFTPQTVVEAPSYDVDYNPTVKDYQGDTAASRGADTAEAAGVAYRDISSATNVDPNIYGGTPQYAEAALSGVNDPEYAKLDSGAMGSLVNANVDIAPGSSYVTDKSTVASQLSDLLAGNSSYIQQAQLAGQRDAASRGLLNTSLASGASEAAAIQAGLPIAQQDAQTFAEFQAAQQTADYGLEGMKGEALISSEMSRQGAALDGAQAMQAAEIASASVVQAAQIEDSRVKSVAAIEQTNQNMNNAFTAQLQAADAQSAAYLQDMQNLYESEMGAIQREHEWSYNTMMQELLFAQELQATSNEYVQQNYLTQYEATETKVLAAMDTISTAMTNMQVGVENMMLDPDFWQMDKDSQVDALNNIINLSRSTVGSIGAIASVDVSDVMNDYMGYFSYVGE